MDMLTATERLGDGTCVVSVAGEVDFYTRTALEEALVGVLDDGATAVTVDLSECGFIDSAGLHVLIGAHARLAQSGGGLALVSVSPHLLGVLEITRLDTLFAIYPSRAAATNGNAHG